MAKKYTKMSDVIIDTGLYLYTKKGTVLSLDLFPSLAENRWEWITQNWISLKERFESSAGGNVAITRKLDDLNRLVVSYKLGNNLNPLTDNSNFVKYRAFLKQITLGELILDPAEIKRRDLIIKDASDLNEDDFLNMISFIRQLTAVEAQKLGLGDDDSAAVLGLKPTQQIRTATIQDLSQFQLAIDLGNLIEGFVFDKQRSQKRPPNLLATANANSDASSQVTVSTAYQTSYPVNFEISLESMALKYLGSAQKWFELITVNNLQPPYVDFVGEKFSLIAPAAANNCIISFAEKNAVAPGMRVGIGSHRFKEERRYIENVQVNESNGTMVLYLSGDQDMNKFTTSHDAYVRIYKPHTVQQNTKILIPSSLAGAPATNKKTPSSDDLRRLNQAFISFGVDVERNELTGDIVLDASGNFRLSAGVKAIKQAVINTLKIRQRELPFHPSYGIQVEMGDKYFGSVSEAVVMADTIKSTIMKDRRFRSAVIDKVGMTETGVALQLSVSIKGVQDPIPLSFIG